MKINDEVYGVEKIEKPILIDLINSRFVQRLKGISQFGMPPEYYHKKGFTRYEHSIGVFLLLKRLGADLKEQIAGLLHDGSHTAFSHVVDWVVGDPTKEDYQDSIHLKSIINSKVPQILSKYGFDYKEISKIEKFSLLEKEAPDLCADRIDYTLREIKAEGKEVVNFVKDLTTKNNEIVFKDVDLAEFFGREYTRLQKEHWASPEARARYYFLAEILRESIDKKIISLEDLVNGEDSSLIELIKSKDSGLSKRLGFLKKGFEIEVVSKGGILLEKKFRYIDPKVLTNGEVKNLSEISLDYNLLLNKEKENSKISKRILIKEK